MVLPIPCRENPFRLRVTIRAVKPVDVVLRGQDAHRRNSVYFSRKVNFDFQNLAEGEDTREIILSMPHSPKLLIMEVFNAFTGDENGFKIEDVTVEKFPERELWADPVTHRYIEFAIDFAKKMGSYRPGYYPSKNGEFLMQLLPVIRDEAGKELITPARVNRGSGRKQVSQQAFLPLSIPIRIFILMHEHEHFHLPTRSETVADLSGLRYFLDMGFPKVEAVYAATKVFDMHPDTVGKQHEKRVEDIMDFIDAYEMGERNRKKIRTR